MLEKRIQELEEAVKEEEKTEEDSFLKHIANLRNLIKRVPPHKMLRFKGKDRTIIIIKQSGRVIRLIDTGQKRFRQKKLPRRFSPEDAALAIAGDKTQELIEFMSSQEVKMELLPVPDGDSQLKSTFSKYL